MLSSLSRCLIFTLLAMFSSVSLAFEAERLDADYQRCSSNASSTAILAECGDKYIHDAQLQMENVYSEVSADQSSETQKELKNEQETWTHFYNSSCKYFLSRPNFGVEGTAVQYPVCKVEVIKSRLYHLQKLFERSK